METRYRNLMLERETSGGGGPYFYSSMSTADPEAHGGSVTSTTINGYYYNNDHPEQYNQHQCQYDQHYHDQYINNHHQPHQYNNGNVQPYHEPSYEEQVNECTEALNNFGYLESNPQHQHQYPIPHQGQRQNAISDPVQQNPYYHPYDDHALRPHLNLHHHQPHQLAGDSHPNVPDSDRFSNGGAGSSTAPEGTTNSGNSPDSATEKNGEDACGENVIIVRGGLYEADLESWTCVATYWPGK